MKGLVTRNTHVQYESPVSSGKKVMAKLKVFVHTSNADAEADTRAMTLAPRTFFPAGLKGPEFKPQTCNFNFSEQASPASKL